MINLIWKMSCHVPPLLAIIAYMNYPKNFRISASSLYFFSIIHNCLLIFFSAYTFTSLSQVMYKEGVFFQNNYYFQKFEFDNIIYYFYLSKYYEFFDTFLLYLTNKSPIFLQKYHHIGAVICWHLCYVYKVDGIWIATLLNSFVHLFMYSYYLGCLLKINTLRYIKRYITTLQLCQLIPQPLSLILYRCETRFNYHIMVFFTLYSIGLVCLFGAFYMNNYITKKSK